MMSAKLKQYFMLEMKQAKNFYGQKNYDAAFPHLERAHILAQAHYLPHFSSHYWMFKVGIKRTDFREIFGQIIRMLGSVGSLVGKYPMGNTGGANVPALKTMPIPDDLAQILKSDG